MGAMPVLDADILNGARQADARVIHENVQAAELIGCVLDDRLPACGIGDIMRDGTCTRADAFGLCAGLVDIDVGDQDACALRCEPRGDGSAKT